MRWTVAPRSLGTVPLQVLAVWAATLPLLYAVLADSDRGIGPMDESHYLMAAQPWADRMAFNGMFGWYAGPLLRLVGEDLARLRILCTVLLLAAALVLARACQVAAQDLAGRPWPGWLAAIWPAGVVSAALCYYTVFVRTPSYNWFAAVGLMLLAAGLVRTVAAERGPGAGLLAGALFAAGAFVTAVGKGTTALAATTVALVAVLGHALFERRSRRVRRHLVAVATGAAATGALLAGLHLVAVQPLSVTVATYRRVAGMLAQVDPARYAADRALPTGATGLRNLVLERPGPYLPLLVLPVLLLVLAWIHPATARRLAARWLPVAALSAWLITLVVVLLRYPGGVPGLAMSAPPLVLAALAAVLVAGAVVGLARAAPRGLPTTGGQGEGGGQPRPGRALLVSLTLLAMGLAYPFGTNVEYSSQLHGAFPVLLAAAAMGVACVPAGATEGGGAVACLAALAGGALVLGAVLVPFTRERAPFQIAPLAQQVLPRSLVPGAPPLLVDAATAGWVDDLRAAAAQGGFAPGGPVLDFSWHPLAVLALDGRPPRVLIPSFPGMAAPGESAAYALRQEDPLLWRRAWLVVPAWQPDQVADRAVAELGRRFPADYERVAVVQAPFDGQQQDLWRPRPNG